MRPGGARETTAKMNLSSAPLGRVRLFGRSPVVTLADSLHHRLISSQASSLAQKTGIIFKLSHYRHLGLGEGIIEMNPHCL